MGKEHIDSDKTSECLDRIITIIKEAKLNISELVILYSNLGYTLGASIEGFKDNGPSLENLNKMYYSNPTIGVALMLQSLLINSWSISIENNEGEE
jgi:hypothetical protein